MQLIFLSFSNFLPLLEGLIDKVGRAAEEFTFCNHKGQHM
jgi:hypothetical protein